MRYLANDNRWVSTEEPPAKGDPGSTEHLVEQGLLHPSYLSGEWDLTTHGIVPTGLIRLTDGPGGVARWASYYDVMMTNPWGHGTIHTIARGLARLPLKLYEPDPSDDSEPGTVSQIINPSRKTAAGKIAWALRYPNLAAPEGQTLPNSPPSRRNLWYGTVVAKLVHANAIWEIRRDRAGGIIGFQLHPMETVDIDEEKLLYKILEPVYGRSFVQQLSNDRKVNRVLTPTDVVHFGLWEGGRRPVSPSPVRALHASIALYDAVSRMMVSFFNNGARVSGHLKVDPATGSKQREEIRQELLRLYGGPQNAGKVVVSTGEWQAFSREPQFQGIVDLMKLSRDEIFVTYGVPPPVMGVMDRAIMSNVREMRDQYVRDLIGPHAEFLAGDFEAQVIDRSPSLADRQVFCEFDVDEQLRPDLWKRAAAFRNLLLLYTPDEARRIERQKALGGTPADPNGYAGTIQRPLNESPLTNMPDYGRRDDVNERRVEIEAERVEIERMKAEHEIKHGSGNEPHIDEPDEPDEEGTDDAD